MKAKTVWAIIIPIIVVLLIVGVFFLKRYTTKDPYPSPEEKALRIEREMDELDEREKSVDAADEKRPALMTSIIGLDPQMEQTKDEKATEAILEKDGYVSERGGVENIETPVLDSGERSLSRRGNLVVMK